MQSHTSYLMEQFALDNMIARSVTLTLVNDRHSKQYDIEIRKVGDGHEVFFRYGSIGSVLKEGKKTRGPVSLQEAETIFQRLQREKTEKPCECCSMVYQSSAKADVPPAPVARVAHGGTTPAARVFKPELLAAVGEVEVDRLIRDDSYGLMTKYDGHRISLFQSDAGITGFQKG